MTTGLNRKSGHPDRAAASMRMRFFDRDLDFADFIRALQCLTALYQRPDTCEHSAGFIHFESNVLLTRGCPHMRREECGLARRGKKLARAVDPCPPIRDAPLMSGVGRSERYGSGWGHTTGIWEAGRMQSSEDNEQGGILPWLGLCEDLRLLSGRFCSVPIVFEVLARRFTICR